MGQIGPSNRIRYRRRNMPKIAIVVTPSGVDSVSVLSDESQARTEAYSLCTRLAKEIDDFDIAVRKKMVMSGEQEPARIQ